MEFCSRVFAASVALLIWVVTGSRLGPDLSSHFTLQPRSLCSDDNVISDGCARLKMLPSNTQPQDISLKEIEDYFLASAEDVTRFGTALEFESSGFECRSLCEKSLAYLRQKRGWLLPNMHGELCMHWSNNTCIEVQPASFTAMQSLAGAMDLSRVNSVDSTEPLASEGETVKAITKPISLTNSVLQLAVQIANLFSVFPSPPIYAHSLLQRMPPEFGDEVPSAERGHWEEIVPLSETWVGSALSLLARRKHMIEVLLGSSDDDVMTSVRRILLGMQRTLSELKVRSGVVKFCRAETLAYVAKLSNGQTETDNGRYIIHVCPSFWGEEFLGDPTYRYGTLVHEASHHWGTLDFMYGFHASMLLSRVRPSDGQMNADTFMWLVYYLNRCDDPSAGVSSDAVAPPVPSVAPKSPCVLMLEPMRNKAVKVKSQCLLEAHVVSLIGVNADGTASFPAKKYGTLEADTLMTSSNLGTFSLKPGTVIKLMFEESCNIWEATAVVAEAKVTASSALMRSLVDSRLDYAAKTVGGLTAKALKRGPLGHMVDGALQFGQQGKYLIFAGRRFKCCKHSSGDINNFPTKLVDVTDPNRLPKASDDLIDKIFSGEDGCGTMFGPGWHTHNSKWFSMLKKEVYDDTCIVGLDQFKEVTKLDEGDFDMYVEVFGGVMTTTTLTECSTSVPGAVLRSNWGLPFFSSRACQCVAPTTVSGKDIHCSASVEMLRFFNAQTLRGKSCRCAASTTTSTLGSTT